MMIIKYLAPIFCNPLVWIAFVLASAIAIWRFIVPKKHRECVRVISFLVFLIVLVALGCVVAYIMGVELCTRGHWFGW